MGLRRRQKYAQMKLIIWREGTGGNEKKKKMKRSRCSICTRGGGGVRGGGRTKEMSVVWIEGPVVKRVECFANDVDRTLLGRSPSGDASHYSRVTIRAKGAQLYLFNPLFHLSLLMPRMAVIPIMRSWSSLGDFKALLSFLFCRRFRPTLTASFQPDSGNESAAPPCLSGGASACSASCLVLHRRSIPTNGWRR